MKRLLLFLFALLASQVTLGQSADQIAGIWITENEKAHVEIYKQSGQYFGKIIRVEGIDDTTSTASSKDPNSNLNRESVLGTILLSDVTYDKGKWQGTLYIPKKDREVKCTLELVNEDELKITVSRFFRSSSKTWTRL
ncbi:DUF2147 domain-containing protein [Rhodohalobacter barkolensis]|uniref:DUF2147 domain-containing protein n=1 Tax=Rhodohalobacter barkolensis TaxID=2053187 RepID=A0A2N0VEM4_9BACT|nr:DUF2147 domain-containing protein [Rhodohalobacter barkolensis]PKD42646.1 hypothetical protein CWD77_14655 [Rhodohalobacter barkolensis]